MLGGAAAGDDLCSLRCPLALNYGRTFFGTNHAFCPSSILEKLPRLPHAFHFGFLDSNLGECCLPTITRDMVMEYLHQGLWGLYPERAGRRRRERAAVSLRASEPPRSLLEVPERVLPLRPTGEPRLSLFETVSLSPFVSLSTLLGATDDGTVSHCLSFVQPRRKERGSREAI